MFRKPSIDDLIRKVTPYSFCDPERMKSLASLARRISDSGPPGDFVECGSYKGGTAALLATFLTHSRHLWIYDSFEGMPPTTAEDGTEARKYVGAGACSPDDVRAVMRLAGVNEKSFTIRKGWFNQTFEEPRARQVAFLHCDCDWYQSVLLTLETFYPAMPPGGCVVLDDFGYWPGCREAFYDFCRRSGEKPLLERVGGTQAWWIKGLAANR